MRLDTTRAAAPISPRKATPIAAPIPKYQIRPISRSRPRINKMAGSIFPRKQSDRLPQLSAKAGDGSRHNMMSAIRMGIRLFTMSGSWIALPGTSLPYTPAKPVAPKPPAENSNRKAARLTTAMIGDKQQPD